MKDSFHVDMSGRIYESKTLGVALIGIKTKINYGCALKGNLIKLIKKRLFSRDVFKDSAKLYAICIFLLVKEVKDNICTLIICNDEDFKIIKSALDKLLKNRCFETSRFVFAQSPYFSSWVSKSNLDGAQELYTKVYSVQV